MDDLKNTAYRSTRVFDMPSATILDPHKLANIVTGTQNGRVCVSMRACTYVSCMLIAAMYVTDMCA